MVDIAQAIDQLTHLEQEHGEQDIGKLQLDQLDNYHALVHAAEDAEEARAAGSGVHEISRGPQPEPARPHMHAHDWEVVNGWGDSATCMHLERFHHIPQDLKGNYAAFHADLHGETYVYPKIHSSVASADHQIDQDPVVRRSHLQAQHRQVLYMIAQLEDEHGQAIRELRRLVTGLAEDVGAHLGEDHPEDPREHLDLPETTSPLFSGVVVKAGSGHFVVENAQRIYPQVGQRIIAYLADATPTAHRPWRGSDVEAFIKAERDNHVDLGLGWHIIDHLLDSYREHADTGTPLLETVEGPGGPMAENQDYIDRLEKAMTPEAWAEIKAGHIEPTFTFAPLGELEALGVGASECSTCGVLVVNPDTHKAWHERVGIAIHTVGYVTAKILTALEDDDA